MLIFPEELFECDETMLADMSFIILHKKFCFSVQTRRLQVPYMNKICLLSYVVSKLFTV